MKFYPANGVYAQVGLLAGADDEGKSFYIRLDQPGVMKFLAEFIPNILSTEGNTLKKINIFCFYVVQFTTLKK